MGRLKTRLIDAEALKERIITPRANGKDLITELIDSMPTIDAEPVRHGKWIEYPIADGMNQCSECGVLRFGESNYCPNCGCRMDKDD